MKALKRFLPKSLLGRTVLIIVMPLILLQVVATAIFFETHWDTVTRRLANGVAGDVAVILEGPTSNLVTRRKERVTGIWMIVDSQAFINVPESLLIASTRPPQDITDLGTMVRLSLGVEQIRLRVVELRLDLLQPLGARRTLLLGPLQLRAGVRGGLHLRLIVSAVALLVMVVLTGDAGARAVYPPDSFNG
mgnify:CR=1 FL=1